MKLNNQKLLSMLLVGAFSLTAPVLAMADLATEKAQPYVISAQQMSKGMTLWETIVAGGSIMIILGLLSLLAGAIIVYFFMTVQINKMAPKKFFEDALYKLERRDTKALTTLCEAENQNNVLSRIVYAGLERISRGGVVAREAMENSTGKEIGTLWQNLSYLADIATIAPLLGLLGTVVGMIQAYSVIAVQAASVKPVLVAAGISKAMITTAAGLIVSIPVLLFYSYFRGRVLEISHVIQSYSADLVKVIEEIN